MRIPRLCLFNEVASGKDVLKAEGSRGNALAGMIGGHIPACDRTRERARAHGTHRNLTQVLQILLLGNRPHKEEAVPVGEELLDGLPDLHCMHSQRRSTDDEQ